MPGIGCFLVFGFVAYHYPARTGSSTPWTRDASRGSWIVTRWLPRIWADRRRNGRRTPRFRCVVPLLRSNEKIGPFMATYLSDFLFFFSWYPANVLPASSELSSFLLSSTRPFLRRNDVCIMRLWIAFLLLETKFWEYGIDFQKLLLNPFP